MKAIYVPPRKTPLAPVEASRGYRAAVTALTGMVPSPQGVAVLHAHGALETGHFGSMFNFDAGNIKANAEYEGFFTSILLNEVLDRGNGPKTYWFAPEGELTSKGGTIVPGTESAVPPGHPQTRLRAYETAAKGLEDKIDFLMGTHWRSALDLALAGQAEAYARRLKRLGYYTAPEDPYARGVSLLYKKYLPVALETNEEPAPLPAHEEEEAERCINTCFRFDIMHLDLRPDRDAFWSELNQERDQAIREP